MKKLIFILLLITYSFAEDTIRAKQTNALYVQNLIKFEELIAREFENYLLKEFKIPAMSDLIADDYLGLNFSTKNILGNTLDFKDKNNLQLNFAITKDVERYVISLYKRDLYREYTNVYVIDDDNKLGDNVSFDYENIDFTKSYISILLQSDEAKNIYEILQGGDLINKDCTGTIKSRYCNFNPNTLRWYNDNEDWIEYDKKLFNSSSVTVKNTTVLNDTKLDDLTIGEYIYIEDGAKYIKLVNSIMKVN